jgi:hypothetical protein
MQDELNLTGWHVVAYHREPSRSAIVPELQLFPGRRRGYRHADGTILEFDSPESEQQAWAAAHRTNAQPEPKRHPTKPGFVAPNGFIHAYEPGNEASRRWAILNALANCKNKPKQIEPSLTTEGYLCLTSPHGSVIVPSPTVEALRAAWHQLHGFRATRKR